MRKHIQIMNTFDLINTPLKGSNLIEASAGTGKTYTLAGLFVRLILENALSADQILVVTFTNAATEELKERIRHKLLQTKEGFLKGGSQDPLIGKLVNRSQDPDRAVQILQDALIDFDKAAIFTIHGFCQKILHENAFETGSLYNTELVTDPSKIVQEIADDYWRKSFYTAPPELVSYAIKKENIKEPSTFINLLERVRYPDVEILPKIEKPGLEALENFRCLFKSLQSAWPAARGIVQGLLKNPALSGTIYGSLKSDQKSSDITKRDLKVLALIERMDRFVADTGTGFPLFSGFEKFTFSKLKSSVKKNHHPPSHEVFKICDRLNNIGGELEAQMEKYLIFLKTEFFGFAREELAKRKKFKNIQFYDDLLLAVQKALKVGGDRDGNLLAKTIKQRYKAALVDEFQDTDAIQYDIFSTLFSSGDNILFMIGDPKQSIYGFRGADIFSYMKASVKAEAKYTLSENWRSDPDLITAVNTIFSNVKSPFLFHEISFIEGKPGDTTVSASRLADAPFKLWYLPSDGKKPVNKSTAVDSIAKAVTAEILMLTSPGADHVQAGDIAVLVRTNRQAQIIKNYLSARHIPAVLYSTGNIFDTDEALEMEQILASIAEPANHRRFRSALVTDMLGGVGEELDPAEKEPLWWQSRYVRFREYYEIWKNYGFIRMFRTLMAREEIKQRVLSLPNGERRLTNILHLTEITHRASIENGLGISALLKWFSEQRGSSSGGVEEHQLRLESDELAVKIVTIHKSKGLEYPIVFCPFGWESSVPRGQEIIFHGTDDTKRLTLDLAARKGGYHMTLAQNELLAENLRLLYVALTRAKMRCYLIWGRINTAETSAMAYVLHGFNCSRRSDTGDNIVGLLAKHFLSLSDDEIVTDLHKLAQKSKGTIEFTLMPTACEGQYESEPLEKEKLACKIFNGRIDKHWKVSSYSSLISKQAVDLELPDYDVFHQSLTHAGELLFDFSGLPSEQIQTADDTKIFSFPKGTRAGVFFHDIFEQLDFSRNDAEYRKDLVIRKLQEYGFDLNWQTEILSTIDNVLSVPFFEEDRDFVLASVTGENRINEMEFYYPLNPIGPRDLKNIFTEHSSLSIDTGFPDRLGKLTFMPTAGYLKGFIDMVFKHRERYYLVDWKSNYLGDHITEYHRSSLSKTMGEAYYTLQYHLYTLALHQYLRLRQPDYRYEKDFGGVFYVFIRGVDQQQGSQYGIFRDLPAPELIGELGKALIPDF